jgi:hypothetical protein
VLDALDDGRRKFCVGRWLGMRVLGDEPPITIDLEESHGASQSSDEQALQADYEAVKRTIETLTKNALDAGSEEDMSAFLDRLVRSVQEAGTSAGIAKYANALRNVIDTYLAAPQDPFSVQFEATRELAAWLYNHQRLPVDSGSVRYELGVASTGSPHGLPLCSAVGGQCRLGAAQRVVGVKLTGDSFWLAEMCAIPYVLLHELVVHAFAAPHAVTSGDGFADGWMDYVAYDLHHEWTRGRLSGKGSPLAVELPPSQQHYQAELLHVARATGRAVIKKNKIAATEAHEALRRQNRGLARAMLWAFSLALNRSDMESTARAEACEQLGRALLQDDASAKRDAEHRWAAAAAAVYSASQASERTQRAEAFAASVL